MTWQAWVIICISTVSQIPALFALFQPLTLKYKKAVVVPFYMAGFFLLFAARMYCYTHFVFIPTDVIFFTVVPLYLFSFSRFICHDKSIKVTLFIALIYTLTVLSHMLAGLLYSFIYGSTQYLIALDSIGNQRMYLSLIANSFEIILCSLFLFLWKRRIGKMYSVIPNAGAFLFVIGGQLIYGISQLLIMLSGQVELHSGAVVGIVISIIGNLAILQILLANSKKKELEEQLGEIQHIRDLEHMHYTDIETRRHEMEKIRHDFANQLSAVQQLISSGDEQHAEQLLNELEIAFVNTKEYTYCKNAIVNAVLIEKQKECDQAGIVLETHIVIDEECKVFPLHLCSVFTNILDNAIHACQPLPREQRKIELRTAVKGDYLHIKCVNPFADYPSKERSGPGYGKIILSDIADHYSGNFTTETIDKKYIAVISLLCTSA